MTIKVTGIRITTGVREELNEFAAQAWRDGTTSEAYTDIREDPTDTIGEALRAVQEHFAGEDDPVFADLCDLVNRAAEEHARTPDRTPQLDMANAEIERLATALQAERAAWQEASGADSPGHLTAALKARRARLTAELAARAPADASLEARAEGALKAWRNNGSISDVADLRSWLAVVRAVDASRPDDPDMAHLRAELQGAIAEATAYAKTIGLRDAEIARLENESRPGLSEEEAQRWGEMVAAKLDKDVDYEAILAVEAMRLTRGDALPETQSTATDAAIDAAVAQAKHAREEERVRALLAESPDMGAIVQYQREHADRAWLLAQIRAASAALVAAGIPDDGRPLAERIAGIDKDIAAAVTREMQSRLDACPISRDRIAALQERARALPETSRDARLLIDDLLSEIQFNALNFSDREDDLLSERDDARDGAKRADEERDAALRAAKVLADGGALGPVANDILDAAALLKRIADGERYPIDPTVDLNREP